MVEGKLAEALAISRTPLREALGRLEGEGLLLKGASRSFSVRSVSAREFFESLKVRETLKSEAAELAAGRVPMQDLVSLRRQVIEAGQVPIQGANTGSRTTASTPQSLLRAAMPFSRHLCAACASQPSCSRSSGL